MNLQRKLKILLLSSVVSLSSGCALWDAYNMAGFDNVEYAQSNSIKTLSEVGADSCKEQLKAKNTFEALYVMSVEFKNYTQHIPNNKEATKLASNLVELAKQGRDLYQQDKPVSEAFCKAKLTQITRSSESVQQVLGAKPR